MRNDQTRGYRDPIDEPDDFDRELERFESSRREWRAKIWFIMLVFTAFIWSVVGLAIWGVASL